MCARPRRGEKWDPGTKSPMESADPLSKAYFVWASPLVSRAATVTQAVQLDDLYVPPTEQGAAAAEKEVQAAWDDEQRRAREASRAPSLAKALWRVVRWDMALTSFYKLGWLIFAMLSNSLLLRELVAYLQPGSTAPDWWGYVVALLFFLVESARSVSVNAHWMVGVSAGVRLRAGVRAMIFSKSLRLRSGGEVGKITSLVNNDAARMLEACSYGEFLFSAPIT